MSILLELLLVVVVAVVGVTNGSGLFRNHKDDVVVGPIELPGARRICASLCTSGLGGRACGAGCVAMTPVDFPSQSNSGNNTGTREAAASSPLPSSSSSSSAAVRNHTRADACPLLCENALGDPLCGCAKRFPLNRRPAADFGKICDYFCEKHSYEIDGCPHCLPTDTYHGRNGIVQAEDEIDWNQWCIERCSQGDGGSACNCDILPLRVNVI